MAVFTDGSSNGTAAYVTNDKKYIEQTAPTIAQIINLRAVAVVFQLLVNDSFNLYTNNHYVFKAL